MQRKVLAKEIANFCNTHKIFAESISEAEIKNIEKQLEHGEFIENLINAIFIKTRNLKDIEAEKLINFILSLEKIRLELEYKDRTLV